MLKTSIPRELKSISIYLSSLLIILILFSCGKGSADKEKRIGIKDGFVFETGTGKPYTGTVTDTVKSQVMSYEVVEGIKSGIFSVKGLNGKTLMEGLLKNNKNEGKWKYYYPSGSLESEGSFINDTVEGKWVWYYEDGILKEEGHFEKGKREGTWILYDEQGKVKSTLNFKSGKKLSEKNRKDPILCSALQGDDERFKSV